jgi:hypothetical protein
MHDKGGVPVLGSQTPVGVFYVQYVHFSSVITTSLALNYHENKEFEIDCMMC